MLKLSYLLVLPNWASAKATCEDCKSYIYLQPDHPSFQSVHPSLLHRIPVVAAYYVLIQSWYRQATPMLLPSQLAIILPIGIRDEEMRLVHGHPCFRTNAYHAKRCHPYAGANIARNLSTNESSSDV